MRGRKPHPLTLAPTDVALLQHIARSRSSPWFQVQHARIVLAVAAGERIQTIAGQMQCDAATVWRVCRRYEQDGLAPLLVERPRTGHPQTISPPATRPVGGAGVPGTNRRGL